MFSTISSFLSSATQSQDDKRAASAASNNDPKRHPSPNNHPPAQDSASVAASNESNKPNADESQARRKRNTQETFIVVRPPPAKSNHPLNLQVQLVPPQARGERGTGTSSSRRSTDFSTDGAGGVTEDGGHALTRTSSNRSDTSMYSGYSSVSSFSSVASSSTSSARRMIIPLYNLQAHNVMTNTIVDAGTDAKVAKLSRKGLEILGLALLEPVEIFGAHTALAIPGTVPLPPSARTSIDSRDAPPPQHILMPSTDRPQTPVSEVSYSSAGPESTPVQAPPLSAPEPMPQTTTGAKKIFGRLFKKRDPMAATPSQSASSSSSSTSRAPLPLPPTSPTASLLRVPKSKPGPPKRMSWAPTSARSIPDTGSDIVVPPSPLHLQPTVLGIQPVLSSPHIPPRGRPHSYAWIVRRWIKGADEGLLGGVLGLVGAGGTDGERRGSVMSTGGSARTGVEVQFVWSRGKAKASTAAARERSAKVASGEHASESSLGSAHHQHHQQGRSRSKRNSVISTATASTAEHAGFDAAGGTRGGDDEDEAEESDPEDSETPWTCTLVVRRVGIAIATPEDMIRLKVATFSPTPHHPKVVALLKVPFPLPDISIDTLSIHRRVVSPQGLARPGSSSGGPGMGAKGGNGTAGLVLTAEEVKDVVCSTGLWLVVRESVGGVGKVSRKGDGWRIRA